jgi:STE24 endopeptidase
VANEDRSTRYQRQRRRAALAGAAVDVVLLAGVLATGAARALADSAAGAAGDAAGTAVFVAALVAIRAALTWPITFVSEVVHERRYGRTRGSLLQWWVGQLWRTVVLTGVLAVAALVVRAAAWWSPAAWWGWAAVAMSIAIVAAAAFVPSLASRSGTGLSPLRRGDLAARLAALAERAGAPGLPVYEWRAAHGMHGVPAMLAGLGPARRILVSDTLLETHSDDEVEVVVAHELAHHRRGDAWWSAALAAAATALGLYASARLLPAAAAPLGLSGPSDTAALPFIALVCGGVAAALAPLANLVSRYQERRADRDALKWTGNAPALVRTLKRLSAEHLAEDRPSFLAHAFFSRHPAVAERIAAAEEWGNAFR